MAKVCISAVSSRCPVYFNSLVTLAIPPQWLMKVRSWKMICEVVFLLAQWSNRQNSSLMLWMSSTFLMYSRKLKVFVSWMSVFSGYAFVIFVCAFVCPRFYQTGLYLFNYVCESVSTTIWVMERTAISRRHVASVFSVSPSLPVAFGK